MRRSSTVAVVLLLAAVSAAAEPSPDDAARAVAEAHARGDVAGVAHRLAVEVEVHVALGLDHHDPHAPVVLDDLADLVFLEAEGDFAEVLAELSNFLYFYFQVELFSVTYNAGYSIIKDNKSGK